jgi:hypothetical protein
VDDQGIPRGTLFRLEYAFDRLGIERIRSQAVDSLSWECNETTAAQNLCRRADGVTRDIRVEVFRRDLEAKGFHRNRDLGVSFPGLMPVASTLAALLHDSAVQAVANGLGERIEFAIGVELDRLAGRVHGDEAVLAPSQVFVEISAQSGANFIVKQVIEQCHEFRAGHLTPSPFFLRK